ncbi:MAG: nucleotidyl transferase AbiEii/AbiGii toxin family protein, partial [Spirochaetales bacterium]|nr:nucleotidyl transferase AbiEii/AbiGii toxin family protein [Spirochaetales bacterium]
LLRGVKLSFFQVPEPFVFPTTPYAFFRVADVPDIALMKLVAVANRGSRKDFADLYCLFRRGLSLQECLELLPRKYGEGAVNDYQVLQSLTWFEDAEQEPLPRMLEPFSWEECKAFFVREVHTLLLPP